MELWVWEGTQATFGGGGSNIPNLNWGVVRRVHVFVRIHKAMFVNFTIMYISFKNKAVLKIQLLCVRQFLETSSSVEFMYEMQTVRGAGAAPLHGMML